MSAPWWAALDVDAPLVEWARKVVSMPSWRFTSEPSGKCLTAYGALGRRAPGHHSGLQYLFAFEHSSDTSFHQRMGNNLKLVWETSCDSFRLRQNICWPPLQVTYWIWWQQHQLVQTSSGLWHSIDVIHFELLILLAKKEKLLRKALTSQWPSEPFDSMVCIGQQHITAFLDTKSSGNWLNQV